MGKAAFWTGTVASHPGNDSMNTDILNELRRIADLLERIAANYSIAPQGFCHLHKTIPLKGDPSQSLYCPICQHPPEESTSPINLGFRSDVLDENTLKAAKKTLEGIVRWENGVRLSRLVLDTYGCKKTAGELLKDLEDISTLQELGRVGKTIDLVACLNRAFKDHSEGKSFFTHEPV